MKNGKCDGIWYKFQKLLKLEKLKKLETLGTEEIGDFTNWRN